MNDISTIVDSAVLPRLTVPGMTELGSAQHDCPDHGPYSSKGQRLERLKREIWTPCPTCEALRLKAQQDAEEARKAELLAARLEEYVRRAAIPARFSDKTLDSFKAEAPAQREALKVARAYLARFEENYRAGRGLVFAGPPGTGKSHMTAAILRGVMPRFASVYVTCSDYIRAIRSSWKGEGDSEDEVLRRYTSVSLLAIDEIGVGFNTDGERKHLFDLLDHRYREMKPTILLSNLTAEEMKTSLGERIFDRLTENSDWVACQWPSYRTKARKESARAGGVEVGQ